MLSSSGFGISLFINIVIICLWHFLSSIISRHVSSKRADYKKGMYHAKKWERKGEFYTENFRIDLWYSFLPTKFNRLGITQSKLQSEDALTIKEYLGVTCRSELCAVINCFYVVCACILDAPYMAFILGSLVVMFNIPFIFSARYVRLMILNELIRKRRELEQQTRRVENSPNVFDLNLF